MYVGSSHRGSGFSSAFSRYSVSSTMTNTLLASVNMLCVISSSRQIVTGRKTRRTHLPFTRVLVAS